METKISIIMPIYNGEHEIKKSIKSILNQTYKNFELVLIDDGSKDKTLEICHNFKSKDDRIVVIHKENGGVSSARNIGLKHATGNYIMFVDNDDKIKRDCLKKSVEFIDKYRADIIKFNFVKKIGIIKKHNEFKAPNHTLIDSNDYDIIYKLLLDSNNFRNCWSCLIKRDIAKSVKFNEHYSMAEDSLYFYECFKLSKSIYLFDEELYIYNYNNKSITHKFDIQKNVKLLEDVINVYYYIEQDINRHRTLKVDSDNFIKNAIKHSIEKCLENSVYKGYLDFIGNLNESKIISSKIRKSTDRSLLDLISLTEHDFIKISRKYKFKNLIKYLIS